jgi:protein associated with RNAse G/E
MAVYYYKTALRMGDYDAAENYLEKYVNAGGTHKTLNQSLKYMDPLYGMDGKLKRKFLAEMDTDEREQYEKALAYIEELKDSGEDIEKEVFTGGGN